MNYIKRYFFPDTVIGASLIADDQVTPKVKNIRQELKQAQADVVTLSEKFGATSKEAAAAAKKAAELKDAIGDAKSLVDAFNPDTKFKAFGASINTVVGGFTALTGAMGLLGVESEEVQKTLLKVQSALALSQGVAQLQEGIQAFKNFGSVIVNTLGKSGAIGLAIAGVAALGIALLEAFDKPSLKARELQKSLDELIKGEIDARKEVLETRNAFKQAELGIISKDEALKKYNEGLGKTIGYAKDLNAAEKITAENADKYIKVQGLKAQANYILAQSSALNAKAVIALNDLEKKTTEGFIGNGIKLLKEEFEQQKKDADDLLKLIDPINEKIKELSATFKSTEIPKKGLEQQAKYTDAYLKTNEELLALSLERTLTAKIDHAEKVKEIDSDRFAHSEFLLQAGLKSEENAANAKIALANLEADQRIMAAKNIGNALGALADLIGKQTAAGKVLAIAQATINMWVGVTEVLRNKTTLPEPLGTINKIASIATVVFTGLSAIKNIVKVPVPGASGGSASVAVSAPLQPQLPGSTSTRLDRDQINQIGNATVRAFVVETDVTTNQERIRRINRQARI